MDASDFAGKRITVMGLGLLGRGVGDVRFLAEQGADLIVTDLKSEAELAPSLAELSSFSNIRYTLGGHDLSDFRDRDLILAAPKTPADSPYLAEAKRNGIPVTMSTALFAVRARNAGAVLVGVTGTRGKTTTTQMIAHILREAGKPVLVGGNIRGVSTLALLPEVRSGTIAVLELDSWQLQGFRAEGLSPHVAVFTTFYPDHQDYYPDMDAYFADKAEIFLHQGTDDVLVLGSQVLPFIEQYRDRIRSAMVVGDLAPLPTLQIPGEHNRYNAALARAAVEACGVTGERADEALATFPGVEGRLEFIREVDGVRIYNDTTATTPEATIAALEALGQNIVLIAGGSDKGLELSALIKAMKAHAKAVILLSGSGTDRLAPLFPDAAVAGTLEEALALARSQAQSGDVLLLSPGFASFGMFKNEYDRGDQFNALVRSL